MFQPMQTTSSIVPAQTSDWSTMLTGFMMPMMMMVMMMSILRPMMSGMTGDK